MTRGNIPMNTLALNKMIVKLVIKKAQPSLLLLFNKVETNSATKAPIGTISHSEPCAVKISVFHNPTAAKTRSVINAKGAIFVAAIRARSRNFPVVRIVRNCKP